MLVKPTNQTYESLDMMSLIKNMTRVLVFQQFVVLGETTPVQFPYLLYEISLILLSN